MKKAELAASVLRMLRQHGRAALIPWDDAKKESQVWRRMAEGRPKVLILDYDGTLAPFVADPAKAVPYPGVVEALARVVRAGGRLVFVTGRDCEDIPKLLDLGLPVEVWGSHGGERLYPDGVKHTLKPTSGQCAGFDEAERWARNAGYAAALERKPGCMSFHLRGMTLDARGAARDDAVGAWGLISREYDLNLRDFDGGIELRVPDIHKGRAVQAVLHESGGGASVFYLGDDFTDEDAFDALSGQGVSVLVRPEPRASSARWWLRPPEDLLAFLGMVASICERDT